MNTMILLKQMKFMKSLFIKHLNWNTIIFSSLAVLRIDGFCSIRHHSTVLSSNTFLPLSNNLQCHNNYNKYQFQSYNIIPDTVHEKSTKYRHTKCSLSSSSSSATTDGSTEQQQQKKNHEEDLLINDLDINNNNNNNNNNHEIMQQVWLDLRGTAVQPNEAIQFLEDLLDNKSIQSYINKILISEKTSMLENNTKESNNINDIDFLYTKTSSSSTFSTDIVFSSNQNKQQQPSKEEEVGYGQIIPYDPRQDGGSLDLMIGLDIISKNQWLIIDQTTNYDDSSYDKFSEEISNMIQFLTSTSISSEDMIMMNMNMNSPSSSKSSSSTNKSGLLWGGGSSSISQSLSSNKMNNEIKIAVHCPTHEALVMIDRIFTRFHCADSLGITTITDSGLVIPAMNTNDNNNRNNDNSDNIRELIMNDFSIKTTTMSSSSSKLKSAMIIPFDSDLWRTVIYMRQK